VTTSSLLHFMLMTYFWSLMMAPICSGKSNMFLAQNLTWLIWGLSPIIRFWASKWFIIVLKVLFKSFNKDMFNPSSSNLKWSLVT
jgi:uncharacterized membrane protein